MNRSEKALPPEHFIETTETWVFDLDNTLYPASSRLFDQVDRKITEFIMGALEMEWDKARKIQKDFFRQYGTSMRGMMTVYNTPPEDYLDYVHDIDLSPVPASPELDKALAQLPGRKVIFTNGSAKHAENVTNKIGISHHFDGIFDIVASDYTPKPDKGVYEKMIATFGINPKTSVMVEDMARNLVPAHDLGMTTVWVRTDSDWAKEGSIGEHIHHAVDDLAIWLEHLVTKTNPR